jgi:hypothetical protein
MNHSGTLELDVRLPPGAATSATAEVAELLEAFGDAVGLGMFPPAVLRARRRDQPGTHLALDVDNLPEHALRVLNGMLFYHHGIIGKLASWQAYDARQPFANLCHTQDRSPELVEPFPFPTTFEPGTDNATPPLNVTIELRAAPVDALRERLVNEVLVWHRLLQGGYPGPDFGPGESGTAQPSIRFNGPSTLRYSVNMWNTGYEAFVPLFCLLQRWSAGGIGVSEVEISS